MFQIFGAILVGGCLVKIATLRFSQVKKERERDAKIKEGRQIDKGREKEGDIKRKKQTDRERDKQTKE